MTEPEDTPGIRALGAFGELNGFIALTWELREAIDEHFPDAVQDVRGAWDDFFTEQPFRGASLNEYLTNYRAV